MIPGGNPYGWGVLGVPMARRLRGEGRKASSGSRMVEFAAAMVRDPLGLTLILGIPLLCLALILVSQLGRRLPAPLVPPKPVEVAVNLQPEVRELPPPRDVQAANVVAPPKPQLAAKLAPVVQPQPAPAAAPVPRVSPEPAPRAVARPSHSRHQEESLLRQPTPKEIQVPAPSRMAFTRTERAAESPSLPSDRRIRVAARSESELPVAPTASRFAEAPRPAVTGLQQKKSTFGAAEPQADLAVHPSLSRKHSRISTGESLPVDKKVSLNRRSGPDLSVAETGLSRIHYPSARASAGQVELPVRHESVVASGRGDEDVLPPPSPGAQANRRERRGDSSLPVPTGQEVAFAGSGAQASLDLPAASGLRRKAQSPSTGTRFSQGKPSSVAFGRGAPDQSLNLPAAKVGSGGGPVTASVQPAEVPGRSYDFLDRMAPAELDPSVRIKLNNLHTCLDPDAEMNLKSRLAGLLSRPALCRSGGVVFDIGTPESAYSIQIDLYNYEKRDFPDKCAALKSALEACEARRFNR